jgi:hypothetical protein
LRVIPSKTASPLAPKDPVAVTFKNLRGGIHRPEPERRFRSR